MSNTTELVARRLDLAARGVDLLGSLIDIANSNSVTAVAFEIGSWLGRERLNRYELQVCFEHARGLLVPNSQGETFLEAVKTGVSSHAVLPLLVQPSGALGRLLLNDPLLCWMVSTATCLLQRHSEKNVTDAMVAFIVNTSAAQEHEYLTSYRLKQHPLRFQLEPVVHKLVSSVWLNVVNSGNKDLTADPAIPGLCSHGRQLESDSFGLFISAIGQNYKKMMIRSSLVPSDLLLWILHHFHGRLRVVLCGKIIHEQDLGPNDLEIELRIDVQCPTDGSCQYTMQSKCKIALCTDVAGSFKEFLVGIVNTKIHDRTESRARNSLYSSASKYPTEGRPNWDTLKIQTKRTAQVIIRWMLQRPIESSFRDRLAFPVRLDEDVKSSKSVGIVADLLARQPSILNFRWRDGLGQPVLADAVNDLTEHFRRFPVNDEAYQAQRDEEPARMSLKSHRPEDILKHLPCLEELLEAAMQTCECIFCRGAPSEASIGMVRNHSLKPGCLQWIAFADVMVLIAHAIAEGFGAPDVSAMTSFGLDHYGTSYLLKNLCCSQEVNWEQWMRIAAEVFLGCPNASEEAYNPVSTMSESNSNTHESHFLSVDSFDTTTIAIQFGSLAVVAPWLDLGRPIQIQGCFGFQIVRGRLCVRMNTRTEQRFQSVEDEFAVVKAQTIDDLTPHDSQLESSTLQAGQDWIQQLDRDPIEMDVMLISGERNTLKLIQRVRSDTFSRLIDPTKAMLRIAQAPEECSCAHAIATHKVAELSKGSISYHLAPCSFDRIVGTWLFGDNKIKRSHDAAPPSTRQKRSRPSKLTLRSERAGTAYIYMTNQLDSYAKFNIAVGLAPEQAVLINRASACVQCCVDQAINAKIDSAAHRFNASRAPDNRWIINTTKQFREVPIHYSPNQMSRIEQ